MAEFLFANLKQIPKNMIDEQESFLVNEYKQLPSCNMLTDYSKYNINIKTLPENEKFKQRMDNLFNSNMYDEEVEKLLNNMDEIIVTQKEIIKNITKLSKCPYNNNDIDNLTLEQIKQELIRIVIYRNYYKNLLSSFNTTKCIKKAQSVPKAKLKGNKLMIMNALYLEKCISRILHRNVKRILTSEDILKTIAQDKDSILQNQSITENDLKNIKKINFVARRLENVKLVALNKCEILLNNLKYLDVIKHNILKCAVSNKNVINPTVGNEIFNQAYLEKQNLCCTDDFKSKDDSLDILPCKEMSDFRNLKSDIKLSSERLSSYKLPIINKKEVKRDNYNIKKLTSEILNEINYENSLSQIPGLPQENSTICTVEKNYTICSIEKTMHNSLHEEIKNLYVGEDILKSKALECRNICPIGRENIKGEIEKCAETFPLHASKKEFQLETLASRKECENISKIEKDTELADLTEKVIANIKEICKISDIKNYADQKLLEKSEINNEERETKMDKHPEQCCKRLQEKIYSNVRNETKLIEPQNELKELKLQTDDSKNLHAENKNFKEKIKCHHKPFCKTLDLLEKKYNDQKNESKSTELQNENKGSIIKIDETKNVHNENENLKEKVKYHRPFSKTLDLLQKIDNNQKEVTDNLNYENKCIPNKPEYDQKESKMILVNSEIQHVAKSKCHQRHCSKRINIPEQITIKQNEEQINYQNKDQVGLSLNGEELESDKFSTQFYTNLGLPEIPENPKEEAELEIEYPEEQQSTSLELPNIMEDNKKQEQKEMRKKIEISNQEIENKLDIFKEDLTEPENLTNDNKSEFNEEKLENIVSIDNGKTKEENESKSDSIELNTLKKVPKKRKKVSANKLMPLNRQSTISVDTIRSNKYKKKLIMLDSEVVNRNLRHSPLERCKILSEAEEKLLKIYEIRYMGKESRFGLIESQGKVVGVKMTETHWTKMSCDGNNHETKSKIPVRIDGKLPKTNITYKYDTKEIKINKNIVKVMYLIEQ